MKNLDIIFNDIDFIKKEVNELCQKYGLQHRYSQRYKNFIQQILKDKNLNFVERNLLKSILDNQTMDYHKLTKLIQFPIYSFGFQDITDQVSQFNTKPMTKIGFDYYNNNLQLQVVTQMNDKTNINQLINNILMYKNLNVIKRFFNIFNNKHEIFFSLNNNKLINLPLNKVFIFILKNMNENWLKSPYSDSFYNSKDIDFGYKPEGSLRISDHWNFGDDHKECQIVNCKNYNEGWKCCQYHNGKYYLIKDFTK